MGWNVANGRSTNRDSPGFVQSVVVAGSGVECRRWLPRSGSATVPGAGRGSQPANGCRRAQCRRRRARGRGGRGRKKNPPRVDGRHRWAAPPATRSCALSSCRRSTAARGPSSLPPWSLPRAGSETTPPRARLHRQGDGARPLLVEPHRRSPRLGRPDDRSVRLVPCRAGRLAGSGGRAPGEVPAPHTPARRAEVDQQWQRHLARSPAMRAFYEEKLAVFIEHARKLYEQAERRQG